MLIKSKLIFLLMPAALVPGQVLANTVTYDLQSLGGNLYSYVYKVANDGTLPGALTGFDIDFDPTLYQESSLTIASPAAISSQWNEAILASGISVPAQYDAMATGSGIVFGTSTTGFTVNFTWLGAGFPASQSFHIYDPNTFLVLESGVTQVVPLPPAIMLFGSALAGLALIARRKRLSMANV